METLLQSPGCSGEFPRCWLAPLGLPFIGLAPLELPFIAARLLQKVP